MIPRRQVRHLNSQMVAMTDRADRPEILVSETDAAAHSITNGARVRVSGDHGTLEGTARVATEVAAGSISVPHGFDVPHPGAVASTRAGIDPLSGMVQLSGVPIRIEPVASQ